MFTCTSVEDAGSGDYAGCNCKCREIQDVTRRVETDLSRRGFISGIAASAATIGLPRSALADFVREMPARPILFTNVRLFDGKSNSLREGIGLLIEGNRVIAVVTDDLVVDGAQVIDCGGRVVMPGLIDAHWHCYFAAVPLPTLLTADIGFLHLAAGAEAERTLMRGFTTVRDLGGPAFALKAAIDQGLVAGPRIYPSGAMITSTGGHGDLRSLSDLPRRTGGPLSTPEQAGAAAIADSADEVRMRVREQLFQGASQIKLVGGGGVSSPRSRIYMSTFSEAELRAGVEEAGDRNSYVAVHAYAPPTIRRAITAGAGCIEHAHLIDGPTARYMADKNVWLSIQPFISEADTGVLTGQSRLSALQVFAGTDNAYNLAREYKLKTAFGSDMLFSENLASRQGKMLAHLTRWYSNAEILRMATAANAELLGLSGLRNPYPGKLGVVEEGALADLLVVDGNPLDDIRLIEDPGRTLMVIMKDGKIYKNTLGT
ncbi:MAG: hydrolase [Hyphomicrobiales bacterium]|nr:hydrolase [Hyphomicrobiales bacterium]